jgi:polyisoprenoid-binding protein YceI
MISEGTVVYTGDEFTSGEFTVDMNTIEDKDLKAPMNDTLNKHLSSPYFFNAAEYPATKVTINSVKDNEVNATINVMGKDMETVIPVKIKKTDKKVTAKGKFTLDFSSYKMMGMTEDPKMPKMYTNPVVNFEIDMVLKAEETEKAAE